jgi:two-component system, sensor histidine kinase and response regulator
LVVEDNPLNAKLVLAQLEQGGYEGTTVESGEEALEALAAGVYSIVLMDCHMSGMDGCATAREIRRREGFERHVIIVGLSSNTASSARAECIEAGMDGYIERPVTTLKLIEQIQQICSRAESAATSGKIAEGAGDVQGHKINTIDADVLAELASLPAKNGSLLLELRDIFLRNLPVMLRDLSEAADASSSELAHAAHRLKSASTTIGGALLASLCRKIEEACADENSSSLARLVIEAREEAARLAEKLRDIPIC